MEIGGKVVPEYKPNGAEWRKAMMEMDKESIVSILKTKCEEVDAILKNDTTNGYSGQWAKETMEFPKSVIVEMFQERGRRLTAQNRHLHKVADDKIGKNMILATERAEAKAELKIVRECVKELQGDKGAMGILLRDIEEDWDGILPHSKKRIRDVLKTVGMEISP